MDITQFAEQYCNYTDYFNLCPAKIRLQQYEKDYLKSLDENRFTISLFSRQMHGSTLFAIKIAYELIFNKTKIGVAALKYDIACNMLEKIREIIRTYEHMTGNEIIKFDSKKRIESKHGSCVNIVNSVMATCSKEFDLFFIDQAAFIHNLDQLLGAVLPITKGLHMISSPNGINNFSKIFDKDNIFKKQRYHYKFNPIFFTPDVIKDIKRHGDDNQWEQEMELEFFSFDKPRTAINSKVPNEIYEEIEKKLFEEKTTMAEYIRQLIYKDLQKEKT